MVDVAQYINEVKRDSDTLQIMRSIQVRKKSCLKHSCGCTCHQISMILVSLFAGKYSGLGHA